MLNILSKIEKANFLATEADVEAMAKARQEGIDMEGQTQSTYLKVLVALAAHEIGGATAHLSRRRGKLATSLTPSEIATHINVLETINTRCYGAVTRAVVTRDIERSEAVTQAEQSRRALERNRRTNYARTAMSAVRAYVQAGQDIRDLDLRTVTKQRLREVAEQHSPPTEAEATARLLRAAGKAADRIVEEAEELAATDPVKAEQLLGLLVDKLEEVMGKIKRGEIERGSTTVVSEAMRAAIRKAA